MFRFSLTSFFLPLLSVFEILSSSLNQFYTEFLDTGRDQLNAVFRTRPPPRPIQLVLQISKCEKTQE